jgi:hypothetical protein
MTTSGDADFRAGQNIAMKVPAHEFEATVGFYRDVVGLEQLQSSENSIAFHFGRLRLWIDRCPHLSRSEVWLQLVTDDADKAVEYLAEHNVVRCDDVERLPDGFDGFWIMNPSQVVHLVTGPKDAEPMTA